MTAEWFASRFDLTSLATWIDHSVIHRFLSFDKHLINFVLNGQWDKLLSIFHQLLSEDEQLNMLKFTYTSRISVSIYIS